MERLQKEAEAHAEDDKKAKELIEVRNNADNLAYQCEKQLADAGDKIDAAKKQPVEEAITKVREALKTDDVDAIKSAHEELEKQFHEVSAELYKQAAAEAGPADAAGDAPEGGEPAPESKKADDVVDAEFEMVDEDKKD